MYSMSNTTMTKAMVVRCLSDISGCASPVDALRRSKAGLYELTRTKKVAITLSIEISLGCGHTSVPEGSLPCVKNTNKRKKRL